MPPEREHEGAMPLMGHLVEFRNRLIWALAAVGVGAMIAFTFGNEIIRVLLLPFPDDVQVVQVDLLEGVRVRMKVALLGGFILSFPVVLYQVVMFIRPALLPHERRFLFTALPVMSAFYVAGVLFCFFVLLPPMMTVLPTFLGGAALPQIRIESVIGTEVWFLFTMGLIFEIPLVMYLLARVGIMNPARVARQRRVAILVAFVAGAVITPTGDPFTMIVWGLPIWALFEAGVIFGRFAWWRRRRAIERRAEAGAT